MITQQHFDQYFALAQRIAFRLESQPEARHELSYLIEKERETCCENLPFDEFFKAEYAFYNGNYSHALKHYLLAKSVPYFKLFCYRASAYISEERDELDKAINFAQQALVIYPDDYASLILLQKLYTRNEQNEKAAEISQKINELVELYKDEKSHALQNYELSPDLSDCHGAEGDTGIENLKHFATSMELVMNPRADFFAPVENSETLSTEMLTNRLYTTSQSTTQPASSYYLAEKPVFGEHASDYSSEQNIEHSVSLSKPKGLSAGKEILEHSIKAFQHKQSEVVGQYLDRFKKRQKLHDHGLYVLQGWDERQQQSQHSGASRPLITDCSRNTSGGYYLRWNNKGIVINPGKNFLDHFHRQGLHIKDIDCVIITGDNPDSYADIKEIYDLNYQLNKVNPELQIINYYLSQKTHQALSRTLKPNFKQERNTVHCLELFLDSPDVEKVELGEGITLNYFPLLSQETLFQNPLAKEERNSTIASSLGIRLDLRSSSFEKQPVRLGYLAGTPWSPLLAHHLGYCDVLIVGFGNTNPNDYGKIKHNDDTLGYFGTYSLMEEINPKLLLCSEFDGNEGDIRIEVVKQLRHDFANTYHNSKTPPVILPVDTKLFLDLKTCQVQCSVTKTLVDSNEICVVKSTENFGNLNYLSPHCST